MVSSENGRNGAEVRVDMHLHSRASGTSSNYWVRGLGGGMEARESYTPPEQAYRMAKDAGMDFVTLTDHETIDGALTLADRPDFFVGEEVSAVFPESGDQVDVLIYGVDADIHREAQARRNDVYALVDYLREAGVVHVLAHPMYGITGNLDRDRVEKRLVLFGLWEFINGSRDAEQNRLSREVALSVGPAGLRQMAARQGLDVPPHGSVAGTGGSDDHGGAYPGATHTVAPAVGSPGEFLEVLAAGEVRPAGESGTPAKLVHAGFRIAAGAIAEGDRKASSPAGGLYARFPLLRRLSREPEDKLMGYVPTLARMDRDRLRAALLRRYEERISRSLGGVGSGFPAVDLLGSLGELVDAHLYAAPYAAVHGYFGREARKARSLRREIFPSEPAEPKVGVFVDGLDDAPAVAATYRNLLQEAGRTGGSTGGCLRLVRCGAGSDERAFTLRPVAGLGVPLYDGLDLGVPSLPDVMEHVAEAGYDALHVAAPGPLGLAALVCGVALGIPVVGAYRTEFGAYAQALSGDAFVAEIVDVAVREFYERCSAVAVPSGATALALRNRGYRIERFETLRNGVDTELFTPTRRDPRLHDSLGGGRTLLLYAGRIGREDGLDELAAGYRALKRRRRASGQDDVHLFFVGDGPYRRALEDFLGDAATFTGFLRGEELARTFATGDVFVFPGVTDTLGQAVAEAQASGLPAVVRGTGGPRERIRPGESGLAADIKDDEAFFARVEELLDDPARRERMGRTARKFATSFSREAMLEDFMALHARVAGLQSHNVPVK